VKLLQEQFGTGGNLLVPGTRW